MSKQIIYGPDGEKIGSSEKIKAGFFNTEKTVRRDNDGNIVETTSNQKDSMANARVKHQDSGGKPTGETVKTTNSFGNTIYQRKDSNGRVVSTSKTRDPLIGKSYKETRDNSGNVTETSKDDNSGFCYLTTACVDYSGLPDNCLELRTLRNFRDRILMNDPKGKKAVSEYYKIAPSLVENINSLTNPGEVWGAVLQDIKIASSFVLKGKFREAFEHYGKMTSGLMKDFF